MSHKTCMVSDQQVKRPWRLVRVELTLENGAAKAGMDAMTPQKYLRERRLPCEMKQEARMKDAARSVPREALGMQASRF